MQVVKLETPPQATPAQTNGLAAPFSLKQEPVAMAQAKAEEGSASQGADNAVKKETKPKPFLYSTKVSTSGIIQCTRAMCIGARLCACVYTRQTSQLSQIRNEFRRGFAGVVKSVNDELMQGCNAGIWV